MKDKLPPFLKCPTEEHCWEYDTFLNSEGEQEDYHVKCRHCPAKGKEVIQEI